MMYVYGEGIHQHYGLGYAWLNAAQLNGENCKDVQKVKKMVEKKFDRAALDNARKMSEQWVDEATLEKLARQKKTRFAFISRGILFLIAVPLFSVLTFLTLIARPSLVALFTLLLFSQGLFRSFNFLCG